MTHSRSDFPEGLVGRGGESGLALLPELPDGNLDANTLPRVKPVELHHRWGPTLDFLKLSNKPQGSELLPGK